MTTAAINDIYNYRTVDASLSTSGQPTEDQLRAIAAAGFSAIINLALHNDPRYSLPDEAGLVRSLGLSYVHIPVQFDNPTKADLLAFFDAMDAHCESKLLVHCAANKRVTAFLGLYRAIRQEWEAERAFTLMKTVWEPDAVWSSFIERMLIEHHG